VGVYGSTVHLAGGGTVKADEAYIRESILNPPAKVVEGYQPLMPTFQGLVTEEGVVQLIEYIKSLSPKPGQTGTVQPTVPAAEPAAPGFQPGNR
jgi:cytochrome c oxidase subunit II